MRMSDFRVVLLSTVKRLCCTSTLFACYLTLAVVSSEQASAATPFAPVPKEVRSSHFIVTVKGHRTAVVHAADNYYLLNFYVEGRTVVSVTADDPHFWDRGVEVQPMRHGLRPRRSGGTITLQIDGPLKLSISRPGEHFAGCDMLFLFANPPEVAPVRTAAPGFRYFGPGLHRENIDAHSGDQIYLAPGAVVLGALNLWQVHDVRVFGTGMIIYDGPQDPTADQGWMHKRNWHCIVMDEAQRIEIDGITCVTRSRTWQVQMKDSRNIGLYNIKIIGGNPHNANQDGLDWLGGGDTTVSNSFFRASDDVFALQGNWEGYDLALLSKPGHDVTNITISDTVVSTSISNTVRVAWPQKTFSSAHFHMHDMDVIHTGFGGCKVPFAFFELWADPDGHGSHEDYRFENIRLEDWYSLFQIRQPAPQVRGVSFTQVWTMDGAAMLPSVLKGDVKQVVVQDATLAGVLGAQPVLETSAEPVAVGHRTIAAGFQYTSGVLLPHRDVRFTAEAPEQWGRRFTWLFGDGTKSSGAVAVHRFSDSKGTLLDDSGRFRVLLHIEDAGNHEAWSSQLVVLDRAAVAPAKAPEAQHAANDSRVFDGTFDVPEDGGYTLTLLTSTAAQMTIDDRTGVSSPRPQAQVCGSVGDAVQPVRDSVVLRKGKHRLRIIRSGSIENAELPTGGSTDSPVVLWEGPGIARQVLELSR